MFPNSVVFCVLLPETIPVILLSRCNVMPQGLLPLFIFEPRYRKMLSHALNNDRFFCVGMHRDDVPEECDDAFHPCSTAGFVRACVHHADGTSCLMLQGVQRIRLTGWVQRQPFRIARIEPVNTVNSAPEQVPELRAAVLNRALAMIAGPDNRALGEKMCGIKDAEILADFIAANFIQDAALRHPLLGMADLNERLGYLLEMLVPV